MILPTVIDVSRRNDRKGRGALVLGLDGGVAETGLIGGLMIESGWDPFRPSESFGDDFGSGTALAKAARARKKIAGFTNMTEGVGESDWA